MHLPHEQPQQHPVDAPPATSNPRPEAVEARAPCRVDLAGGTLDLYPLCVMLGGAVTVNAAITRLVRCRVRRRPDPRIVLRALDLNEEVTFPSLSALDERLHDGSTPPLALLAETVRFWAPTGGFELETESEAPKGSGLGASSALVIAVLGAFARVFGPPAELDTEPSTADLCRFAAAIETHHLQVPAGTQDYLAALHGGPLAIRYTLADTRLERNVAERSRTWLAEHLLVIYSGAAHFSGAPNWAVLKRYVDGDRATRRRLRAIDTVARRMWTALEGGDPEAIAPLVREEWALRRGLADEVSPPHLERLISALSEAGAIAVKACGAGGGGSLLVLCPPERRDTVLAAASAHGATHLDATLRPHGLEVVPR